MKISTYISTKNNKSVVMLNISFNGFRVQLSSGVSVLPEFYDSKKIISDKDIEAQYKRQKIKNIISFIYQFENQYELTNGPGSLKPEILKSALKSKKTISKKSDNLIQNLDKFISNIKSGNVLSKDSRKYSHSSILQYQYLSNLLQEFYPEMKLTFDDVDPNFFNSFTQFCYEKNLSNNTIYQIYSKLKAFMNTEYENSTHNNISFKSLKFKAVESDLFAFSEDDILKIHNHQDPKRNLFKVMFMVQFLTGQRYSDLKRINSSTINFENQIITFRQQKTENKVIIPITPILENYLHQFVKFKIPTIQNQITQLKRIARDCGLNSLITKTKILAGVRKDITLPMYELVSTHIARRSFITISLKKGVAPQVIMKITGHTDFSSFEKYVKFNEEDIKNIYSKVELF